MEILDLSVMRGPNYWSNYRHTVIVMKLDIGELENFPSNKISGFNERLKKLIPSLYEHCCSEGHKGGFFERLDEGTWMGHVVEHIAIEIQTLAGMYCGYGRTRVTKTTGIYNVVYAYENERAGLYAGRLAVNIADKLITGEDIPIAEEIEKLRKMGIRDHLGPSTGSIVEEAKKRNIPYRKTGNGSLILFGQGINQKKIKATMTSSTSSIGVEIACDKEETKRILSGAYIPMPVGDVASSKEELFQIIEEIGFPLALKPIDGNHGRGVTTHIETHEQALEAFQLAQTISQEVIVERFIKGYDFRFLLINYKLVAVAERTPAMVMGDGVSTIQQLINETNKDPNRGECHEKNLTLIKVDEVTKKILKGKNLTLESVIPLGEILLLKDTANLSTGGTSKDVTDLVHPFNILLAERIARLMNLDICGIDVVAENVEVPITEKTGAIIEVNACPGFRMHLCPAKGLARNVAAPVIDMLYPDNKNARIPLIAVTGTNGKTTTTRLIAHIARQAGHKVGFTTTDGIYIQEQLIHKGDCSGPVSAETVLSEPTIDFAVLECARGGIIRHGLGFDHCNVSIVTNVTEDHLGLEDIETMEEMAQVKMVVPRSTFEYGHAILNAEDDIVYGMKKDLQCRIGLFSLDPTNERVQQHCQTGGLACIVEDNYIVICNGQWKMRVCKVKEVPITLSGRATSMIKNVLPCVLTAFIQGFDLEVVREALKTFIPSPEYTPGRMNIFKFKDFELMIDYAHNTGGFMEMKSFIDNVDSPCKIGIITGVGDRRDEDIMHVGNLAGQAFDEIIIRHDADLRGRTEKEITDLLMQGITEVSPAMPVAVISDEKDAIKYAIDIAKPGTFIMVCSDSVQKSIEFVTALVEKEKEREMHAPEYILSKAS